MPQHEKVVVGIAALRMAVEKTGRYRPADALPEFRYNEKNELVAAAVFVWKLYDLTWVKCPAIAFYSEVAHRKADGSIVSPWLDRPHMMLSECAEALALEQAFPSETSKYQADTLVAAEHSRLNPPPESVVPPPAVEPTATAGKLRDPTDTDQPSELEGGLGLDMISTDDLMTLGKIAEKVVAEKRAGRLSESAVTRLRLHYDEAKARIKSGATEPLPGVK